MRFVILLLSLFVFGCQDKKEDLQTPTKRFLTTEAKSRAELEKELEQERRLNEEIQQRFHAYQEKVKYELAQKRHLEREYDSLMQKYKSQIYENGSHIDQKYSLERQLNALKAELALADERAQLQQRTFDKEKDSIINQQQNAQVQAKALILIQAQEEQLNRYKELIESQELVGFQCFYTDKNKRKTLLSQQGTHKQREVGEIEVQVTINLLKFELEIAPTVSENMRVKLCLYQGDNLLDYQDMRLQGGKRNTTWSALAAGSYEFKLSYNEQIFYEGYHFSIEP
jgi:hypothetical protein